MQGRVYADSPAGDPTAAIQLYDSAMQLMKTGSFATACSKFKESERLDPQLGTLLHLADCYEKAGKVASAWASFKDAADLASKVADSGKKWRGSVLSRLNRSSHGSRLRWLNPSLAGLELKRDGLMMGSAQWGTAVVVNPGKHVVSASAPHKKEWTGTVEVAPNGLSASLTVPVLQDAPEDVGGPVASTRVGGRSQRTIGLVIGGVGAVGLAVGGVLALAAKARFNEASGDCDSSGCNAELSDSP